MRPEICLCVLKALKHVNLHVYALLPNATFAFRTRKTSSTLSGAQTSSMAVGVVSFGKS